MPDETGSAGPETGSTPGLTRWRKKPVEVDMILWDGTDEAWQLIANHGGLPERLPDGSVNIWVEASQAEMNLDQGSWAIIEQDGSGVYPCRAADHVTTYEPVTYPDPGQISLSREDVQRLVLMALPMTRDDDKFVVRLSAAAEVSG